MADSYFNSSSSDQGPLLGPLFGGYQSALAASNATYQQILNGYAAQAAYQRIGYANLSSNVMKQIQGVDASQRQAIKDAYAQQTGQATQGLITSGLGNTTVTSSVQRGLALDKQKADIALSNQMAQLKAGYLANLGMAGLGSQQQLWGAQAGLASQGAGQRAGLAGAYLSQLRGGHSQSYGAGGGGSGGGGGMGRFGYDTGSGLPPGFQMPGGGATGFGYSAGLGGGYGFGLGGAKGGMMGVSSQGPESFAGGLARQGAAAFGGGDEWDMYEDADF